MRRLIPLSLLLACSGNEIVRVDLPIEAEHEALVLAVEDGDELDVYALDLESQRQPILQTLIPSYIGSYEVRLTAFLYRVPLEELGLVPGAMLEAPDEPNRLIPSATSTLTASLHGAEIGAWTPIDRAEEPVASFKIPTAPVEECIQQGGCFGERSSVCLLPCPPAEEPEPPVPPIVPTSTCPPGWDDVEVRPEVAACTPWAGGTPACSGDTTIFPGESSCHALGPGCPTGTWPTDLPAGARTYVLAGAAGGDGSEAAPFGSIQTAIDQAAAGGVIVIGAGTYRESLQLTAAVTLVGACPEQTIIDGPGGAAITVEVPSTTVRNLTITADDDAIELDDGASLLVADAIIHETGGTGINMVNAARVELVDVLIRDGGGSAIWMQSDAVLVGTRVHISNAGGGAMTVNGADLTLTDAVVRDSRPNRQGTFGRGANIQNGATAVIRRSLFDNHHDISVFVSTADAELESVVLRRTRSRVSDGGAGFGLLVQNGAHATVRRSWIDENQDSNLYVFGNEAVATIEDSVLSRARINDEDGGGFNAHVVGGSSAVLRRVVATDSDYTSIDIGDGNNVQLEDVTVLGAGIHPATRRSGDGVNIHGNVDASMVRVRIEDTAAEAISVAGGASHATLRDITIARAGGGDCHFCSGLCINDSARVEDAVRIRIDDVLGVGVYVFDQDSSLVTSHLSVSGTGRSAPCVLNHNVRDVGRGVGLYAADGGRIRASNFLFTRNAESGAAVAEFLPTSMGTALDLSHGLIRGNPIGGTILIEGYDARRLAELVVYSDNEINLNYEQ